MKAFNSLAQKIDALSVRERVILFVLMLAAIWAVMDALLLAPQESVRKAEQGKITQARNKLDEAEHALALRASQPDPDKDAQQRLEGARAALQARMQMATTIQARMVAPKDQVRVLQGLLSDQTGLQLRNLDTLPPEPVGLASPDPVPAGGLKQAAAQDAGPAALYKHGVKLTLVGSYATLTRYMERLERLPLGFYWARAELDASAYPEVNLTLILYTLSLERTWLTV
jgi:MSHA biogenesis protein MshJ